MNRRLLSATIEEWPVQGVFRISRGAYEKVSVIVVRVEEDGACGWGEGRPYQRFGETDSSVMGQVEEIQTRIEQGADRQELQQLLPPGAARNATDCALWDLEAKKQGQPVWSLAGLAEPAPVMTAHSVGLDDPEIMAEKARLLSQRFPLIKLKLGGEGDGARVAAVRKAAPEVRLIVDANEAWHPAEIERRLDQMASFGVEFVEQPLPESEDDVLASVNSPVPIYADESCRDTSTLDRLVGRYDGVNVKLDKAGGLTEALRVVSAARTLNFSILVGSMVGTSLALAPSVLLASLSDLADLDGPLLLSRDRTPSVEYEGESVLPPPEALWG